MPSPILRQYATNRCAFAKERRRLVPLSASEKLGERNRDAGISAVERCHSSKWF